MDETTADAILTYVKIIDEKVTRLQSDVGHVKADVGRVESRLTELTIKVGLQNKKIENNKKKLLETETSYKN